MARHEHGRISAGFTIVELMIATAVLSMVLLLVTFVIIGIGNLYYKGTNQARVQDGVRAIADNLSEELQLNDPSSLSQGIDSGDYAVPINVLCIGNTRYSYVMNVQVGQKLNGTTMPHILWRDNPSTGCVSTQAANLTSASLRTPNGSELITPNSRLTALCVGSLTLAPVSCAPAATSPYTISIAIAYGNDDLLCDTGTRGDCSSSSTSTHLIAPAGTIACKGNIGDQFCATANLTTTAVSRL